MSEPFFDLRAYLDRIGLAGRFDPTLATLRTVIGAHSAAIPYENVDVLLGRPPKLDLDSLQAKLVRGKRGGYCFEHNTLLRAGLQALGFTATGMLARVVRGGRVGGKAAELGAKVFGEGWEERVTEVAEGALWRAHDIATVGLDAEGDGEPWDWLNKAVTSTSGAVSGFFGLPGALVDIPISTLIIMRSVAEIARANGENLSSEDAKRACLEVFAFAGPETDDDDSEVGYWTARLSLTHLAIEAAIRRIATAFGVVLSEKVAATAVPLIGSAAGGMLNYAFMDFYQDMARVHFSLRALERQYGDEGGVRACFDALVRQARDQKKIRPSKAAGASAPQSSSPRQVLGHVPDHPGVDGKPVRLLDASRSVTRS